jgi:hypothetical protein
MSQVPTLIPGKPLVVRLRGNSPAAKFPMCITFRPAPGVTMSLPMAPCTNFRYSPEFQTAVCIPHPGETGEQFKARVESNAGGAYVVLTIDARGRIEVVAAAIYGDHPYLAQTEYNYDLIEKMAKENVEEALRTGAIVIKGE